MPIYTYTCESCGYVFEDLVSFDSKDADRACSLCSASAKRNAAEVFGIKTSLNPQTDTIYSPKEIDKVVGEKADKKWAGYDERWSQRYKDRQTARWNGKTPTEVSIPKDPDGKYTPLMHIGDTKDRTLRKEYSTALQEHRAERSKKGIGQFDAPGAIIQD
jgi:putative FmdB family regulatory protein